METMSTVINFNSTDWESIEDTIEKINTIGCFQIGETSEGESITFDVGADEDGDYLITEVLQSNGWVRKNIYHPYNCTVEEEYHK